MLKTIEKIPLKYIPIGNILFTLATLIVMGHDLSIIEYIVIGGFALSYILISNIRIAIDHRDYAKTEGQWGGIFTLFLTILLIAILLIFAINELSILACIYAIIVNLMLYIFNYWTFR